MSLLQRYVLKQLCKVFVLNLTGFTLLLVFVGAFREAQEKGLGPMQLLRVLPYTVPSLLPFTMPATLLLTVCLVYGRLACSSEITAAKAAGINVMTLLWPALFMGSVLSVGSLLLNDQVTPWAIRSVQRLLVSEMENLVLETLRSKAYIANNALGISINVTGVTGKTLIHPTFQYRPHGRVALSMQAEEATLEFDHKRQQLILHLYRGDIETAQGDHLWFEEQHQPFPLPSETRRKKPLELSIYETRQELQGMRLQKQVELQERELETAIILAAGNFDHFFDAGFLDHTHQLDELQSRQRRLHTEIHTRVALSCGCFFFVLLGCPVAIIQARHEFLTNFLICFLPILLTYYPLILLTINLSKGGNVNPAWAMWTGNAILGVAALVALRRVLRH